MSNIINREGAEALIPEEASKQIIQGAIAQSVVLTRFTKLPNMSSKVTTMPVLKMLPVGYFVDGDTGFKKSSKMAWGKKRLVAEEIAVIIPIPESVLADAEDSGYDIWGEVQPRISEEFGRVIDNAVIFGVGAPAGWRKSLIDTIKDSGQTVPETKDLYGDILAEDGVFSKVEDSGYEVTGCVAGVKIKASLRGLRDENGQPIFKKDLQSSTQYALDGAPLIFSKNGTWDNSKAKLIVGDMSKAVYSIRQDLTFKVLTEGVIQDPETKEILFNLGQQDMVALRCVMRLAWELFEPVNAENKDNDERLPFAALVPNDGTSLESLDDDNGGAGEPAPQNDGGAGEEAGAVDGKSSKSSKSTK